MKKFFDIVPPGKIAAKKEKADLKTQTKKIVEHKKRGAWKYVFAFIAIVFLVGAAGQFWFSNIKIKIRPKTQEINFNTKIGVDLSVNQIDFETGVIPGQTLRTQKSDTEKFLSTGKETKQVKAKGVIRVYNGYSESPRTLVKSRFVSADGKLFWSLKTAVIPGAVKDSKGKLTPGFADVNVEAAEPGEDYNIGPTTFAMPALAGTPLYSSIYGKSFSAMSGGFNKEIIKVTQQDIDSAKDSLIKEIEQANKNFLESNFSDKFFVLDGSFSDEILAASSSLQAGAEADSFEVKADIKTTVMAISKKDLDDIIQDGAILNARGLFGAEGGIVFSPQVKEDGLEENFTIDSIDLEKGKAVLDVRAKAIVFAYSELSDLKKAVFGKSAKETELFLKELDNIESADIKYWPFWMGRAPENDCKIAIDFEI